VSPKEKKEIGYADALAELEEILDELEGDQLDVDVLAERVRRASELIKVCRGRIARAQADVDAIVADLADFDTAPGADAPDDDDLDAVDDDSVDD
jgi:exodeoxyribonuclease VII small subunit